MNDKIIMYILMIALVLVAISVPLGMIKGESRKVRYTKYLIGLVVGTILFFVFLFPNISIN